MEGAVRRMWVLGVGVVSVVGFVAVARRKVVGDASPRVRFDPIVVGTVEAAGWRAYYDRDFVTGFRLLLRLMHEQFGLGPLDTIRAAHAAVRAQRAFVPTSNDHAAALRWLTRFYAHSPRRDGVAAIDLAHAELDYWIVHRQIVDEDDKSALVDAFARLHTLLFGGDEGEMRPSAEQRTLACNAVDRITSKTSTNPDEDWQRVRRHLIAAYQLAVAASPARAPR